MRRIVAVLLALVVCLLAAPAAGDVIEFRNGRWLTGDTFVAGTRYSVDGVLQHFRIAVNAGVDLIAHMPGTGAGEHPNELARYRITEADARLAARKKVKVITTLTWLDELEDRALAKRIESELIVPNVRLLKKHGVPLLIGSDAFRETPVRELFIFGRMGLFTNAEILRIAARDTPRAIFPGRKIGAFDDGSEASFLVLDRNPLDDLQAVKGILLFVKKGAILPR